jgi:ribosomal protein S18 acetylase RimI-like enzyme
MTETTYRLAGHDDETDILAVLEEVASEIPVRLDGEERQEKIQTIIVECHTSGKSWVAVDATAKVVGFILARPDAHEGKAAISILYVGVSADSRHSGVFSALLDKLKADGVPLIASVLPNNQSDMGAHLTKRGFVATGPKGNATGYLWTPISKTRS